MLISRKKYLRFFCYFFLNMNWIIDVLHIPEAVKNIIYVLAMILIVWTLCNSNKHRIEKENRWVVKWIILYTVGIIAGWCINGMSPILFLWAFTKTYLLFFFFITCSIVYDIDEMEAFFDLLYKYQKVNVIMCIFQFLILHKSGDWLGGIFGIRQGANAYTNIYFMIICVYSMVKYLKKQQKLRSLLWILGSSCIVAGITELTAFFVELAIILVVSTLLSRNVSRKTTAMVMGTSIVLLGVFTLLTFFPERLSNIYNLDSLMIYLGGRENSYYTANGFYVGGAYSVSRLNPFKQINDRYFKDDIAKLLFGYGLGNCEMSTNISILQSDFYLSNKSYVYYIFSHAATFIETGYWGVFCYAYMLFNLVKSWFKHHKEVNAHSGLMDVGIVMVVMTIVLFFYNSSVRTISAFLLYISLCSIPIYVKWSNSRRYQSN